MDSPFYGAYLFGDFQTRRLYAARLSDGPGAPPAIIGNAPDPISTFGMDDRGNLYVAGYVNGKIYRLTHPGLIGKGLALRPRPGRKPQAPLVRRRLAAADFPDARAIEVAAPDGRVLRRYDSRQLSGGVEPDLPRGLNALRILTGTAARTRALLLP
jgi:hypothetical protein